jgi:bacillithiol system protein YtxJ
LQEEITPYFLDLLNHRDISNEIASKFEVVHQSPQLLLIKNGKSIYNTSHENIDAIVLREKI